MRSSSEEGKQEASLSPTWKERRFSFQKPVAQRRRPNELASLRTKRNPSQENVTNRGENRLRSHSAGELTRIDFKSQWASVIIAQQPVQQSILGLQEAAERYEKHATQNQWDELLIAQADVAELQELADSKSQGKSTSKFQAGLNKFCSVALEYSKLLDVIMNQCPEYAALAWGAMKLLLVANVNHAKVKENVEKQLLAIGHQVGLVNQFVFYNPTEKMAEAVGLLYAHFSRFLKKALGMYAKSKLRSVLSAFAAPWETKFQMIVERINEDFQRIKDLCSANHFGTALQNNHLLHTIWSGHQEVHKALLGIQNNEQLRQKIKQDLSLEISGMIRSFEKNWVGGWERILRQQASTAKGGEGVSCRPEPKDCLSAEVSTEQRLSSFRERICPGLDHFEKWEKSHRARSRNMSVCDYQYCAKLLGHQEMKSWMEKDESSLIWVNSHQNERAVDWVSVLATNIVDHAKNLTCVTMLRHFCIGSYSNKLGSNPYTVLQAFIFQMLRLHRTRFLNNHSLGLSLPRFKEARQDLEQLWEVFDEVVKTAKVSCVWLVIDHIDILLKESTPGETLQLLAFLEGMLQDDSITVKILVTARLGGSTLLSKLACESEAISPDHAIINVPRGYQRHEAVLPRLAPRRPHRLPEVTSNEARVSSKEKPQSDTVTFWSDESSDSDNVRDCELETPSASEMKEANDEVDRDSEDSESTASNHDDRFLSSEEDKTDIDISSLGPRNAVASTTRPRGSDDSSSEEDPELFVAPKIPKLVHRITWDTETADSDDFRRSSNLPLRGPPILVVPPSVKTGKLGNGAKRFELRGKQQGLAGKVTSSKLAVETKMSLVSDSGSDGSD